jgi:hypothetical protein
VLGAALQEQLVGPHGDGVMCRRRGRNGS